MFELGVENSSKRPDINKKRSDLLKLQGEFHLRLRQLEKSLLQALNDAKGKILNDDFVITILKTLKQEAADISKKVEETDKIITKLETRSNICLCRRRVQTCISRWTASIRYTSCINTR